MIEQIIELENQLSINVKASEMDSKKPTVVLIHFSGGTSAIWNGVVPFLEDDFNLLIPDLRGHGKSSCPESGYHIEDMAEDLYFLIKELKIDCCHCVGSSLGAEVGVSLAAEHPELVQSLVCEGAIYNEFGEYGLFNGSIEEIELEKEKIRSRLAERREIVFPSREEFFSFYKKPINELGLWNQHFHEFIDSCWKESSNGGYVHFYKNHVRNEYMQKYWELEFEQYYRKIKCPVLFMPSKEEWSNPKIKKSLEYFASHLETCEITLLEDSLHAYMWMQMPEKGAKAVKTFLGGQINIT